MGSMFEMFREVDLKELGETIKVVTKQRFEGKDNG